MSDAAENDLDPPTRGSETGSPNAEPNPEPSVEPAESLDNRQPARSIAEELAAEIDLAEWDWLKPHIARDAAIILAPELDLVDVGLAMANNNAQAIDRWIAEQAITKPTHDQLNTWNTQEPKFDALIIAPYVLVKERG